MAKIKTCRDMMNLALELVDGVLDGSVDPKRAAAASRMMNTALSAAIAEARYQKQMEGAGFFGIPDNGKPRNLGPRFEWDDGKTDSFGSYVGTKLMLQAFKSKGMLHSWKVTLDGPSPVPIGEGADSPGMEAAKRNAERCAVAFMEKNPRLESGNGSAGETNGYEGMHTGMGHQ